MRPEAMSDHEGRVVVIGSINWDRSFDLLRIPDPGETVSALAAHEHLGGKGANQAIAAARAGADTVLLGAIGSDEPGRRARAALRAEHLDARLAVRDGETGSAVVLVADSGENVVIVHGGANDTVTADDAIGVVSVDDTVVLQGELPGHAVEAAARDGRRRGATIVFNAAPAHEDALRVLPFVDILIVNETEALELSPLEREPLAAARSLQKRNSASVILTRGAEGSRALTPAGEIQVPALPVAAIDSTAAGDTYIGYLVAELSAGSDLGSAMRVATAAAAVAVTRRGSAASIPSRGELRLEISAPTRSAGRKVR